MSTASSVPAESYRGRGWSVIPLKARSKAPKLPKGHPYLSRRATDEEFPTFDFSHNVGIVTGRVSGIVVLDDDDGGATLKERGWSVPPTPTVKTARGHQYYFRCPGDGFPTFDLVPGKIQVKADRGYVVAPPSIHPSGHRYEWVISPDDVPLADVPAWLFEQGSASSSRRRLGAEHVKGSGIADGERNNTLFSLGCALRRRGADESAILAALSGINAEKCRPPLEADEVARIAHSAAGFEPAGMGQSGAETRYSHSHSLGSTGIGNEPGNGIQATSFSGRAKPAPRTWLVERAICSGHAATWYGEGGIAKSLLAAHLGLSVASSERDYWAGLKAATVPVLYCDFELDEDEHLRRCLELVAGMGLEDVPTNFHYLELAGMPTAEAFKLAASEAKRLGVGLVIVDSVGFALDGDSEVARDVLRFHKEYIGPIRGTGATPLLIDHQAKVIKGEKYSDKQEFGSVYKSNAARSSFQIRGSWDGPELTATFAHKKNNFGPKLEDFSVRVVFGSEKITVKRLGEAATDPDREPSKKERVYAAIRELDGASAEKGGYSPGNATSAPRERF